MRQISRPLVPGTAYDIMKRFFWYGLASGIRFKIPASGYDRRKDVISFTTSCQLYRP